MTAKIEAVISEENDGGIIYQNLNLKTEDGENIYIRHELLSSTIGKLDVGDEVIYENVDDNYQIVTSSRGPWVVITLISAFLLLVFAVGLDDMKELLPVFVIAPFVFSGLLIELIEYAHPLVIFTLILAGVTILTTYAYSSKKGVVFTATFSNLLTLLFVLIVNAALLDIFNLSETYNNFVGIRNDMEFDQYWTLLNLSVLFIVFGGVINNSIILARRAQQLFDSKIRVREVIRKLVVGSQQSIARRMNNFFLVFSGLAIIPLAISLEQNYPFWNDINLIRFFVFWISSVIAVIISVFSSALIAGIFLNLNKKENKDGQESIQIRY